MITAVDTSVLLDVFLPDDQFGAQSKQRLRAAYDDGAIMVCDIVYAELEASFRNRSALDAALRATNVSTSPINSKIAYEAGLRWKRYRQAGGPRTRIISDFLIGAHATNRTHPQAAIGFRRHLSIDHVLRAWHQVPFRTPAASCLARGCLAASQGREEIPPSPLVRASPAVR